jgi:sensor histidine kinase YesM
LGKLDDSILEEFEFWRAVKVNSNFLIFEDRLSFEDLQKFNAITDMNDDIQKADNELQEQELERLRKNK